LLARPWNSNDRPSLRANTDFALSLLFQKDDPVNQAIVTVVEEIAKERGLPMATISTAWCLSKGVNPIVGLNSKERIDEVVKAVKLVLSEEEIAKLEVAYVPKSVVGF
jgi:aryl-alcohol dehydrogenase-like predicted oxidoreductase